MKLLKDILYKAGIRDVAGSTNVAITEIGFNSAAMEKYGLFVAVRGSRADGHEFIPEAIAKGAAAIICEEFPSEQQKGVTYVKVHSTRAALGHIASNFYDQPSSRLKLVGVTGTNGKTTVATLLFTLFRSLGYKAGLISTVRYQVMDRVLPATHTTPDAIQLNRLLNEMAEAGCTHCFMEVSSHSVDQGRTEGLLFAGGIFTNITHDHLDYHKTFDEYIVAKKKFFDHLPESAFALVNRDDRHADVMVQNSRAQKKTFAVNSMADYRCKVLDNQFSGLHLSIEDTEVWSRLIGRFNASNLLAVYAAAMLLREDKMHILTALSKLQPVEGRFQYIASHGITGIVDYAHTPDALRNVLATIRDIRTGNEKVITVVGCGGDRDRGKRPVMAAIACEHSDKVILTSDNPRSEDPAAIIAEMKKGVDKANARKCLSVTDRREAIKTACSLASEGDIILVAGKGHEKYQETQGVRQPFDDMEVLKETFQMTYNG